MNKILGTAASDLELQRFFEKADGEQALLKGLVVIDSLLKAKEQNIDSLQPDELTDCIGGLTKEDGYIESVAIALEKYTEKP